MAGVVFFSAGVVLRTFPTWENIVPGTFPEPSSGCLPIEDLLSFPYSHRTHNMNLPEPTMRDGRVRIIESLMTSSHAMTYSCMYGYSEPQVTIAYNRHVRNWANAVLDKCAADSTIRTSLRRAFELIGVDNPPDGSFDVDSDFEKFGDIYTSVLPFFGGSDYWTSAAQDAAVSPLLQRLLASDESPSDLKCLVLLFDYVGFPFEPLNLVRGPRVGEYGKHRRMCGCVHAVVTYARWQTEVDIMYDVTTMHLTQISNANCDLPPPDGGLDPNAIEMEVAELLVGSMHQMRLRNRVESKRLFTEAKEKQIEVLERIEDLCQDDTVEVVSVGTNVSDGSASSLRGENVFLDYGKQMVRISNFINELFEAADKWGHWHTGGEIGGVWRLIDPSNWSRVEDVSTAVAASRGVSMD